MQIPRAIRLFIMLPVLVFIWGAANTLGVTGMLGQAAGLPAGWSSWEIPGLAELLDARALTGELAGEAKEEARKAAVKALKAEVRRRYGPEAAALVPSDLNKKQAKNFDFDAFEKKLEAKLPHKPTQPKNPDPSPAPGGKAVYAQALKTLDTLAVKGKSPMTGYDRDEFGTEWDDSVGDWKWSRNGLDTRNDVLSRDLVDVECAPGTTSKTGSCKVLSGVLAYEPYTGTKNYRFDSQDDDYATDLDIEHIVALGNVWVTGGAGWDEEKRALVANDPLNLMAADPSSNRQKGDADYATWLPSNKSYRADYAVRQIQVKAKYGLWVTAPEKAALERVLTAAAD